jgi:Tol biopolymer transport system component
MALASRTSVIMPSNLYRSIAVVLATVVTLSATPAAAQYFGQNRVQYKRFDYQVLKTEHFDIYFYPEERAGVDIAARLAERWHARLERFFDHTLRGRQPLVLYASHVDFEQNTIAPDAAGEGTGGVTEPLRRRIVLPFGGPLVDTDHVIGHELVHAFQFDITTNPNSPPGENGAERLPLWFIEGMAEYLSLGPVDPNTSMWLRDAALHEKLPAIHDLDDPKYFPYRWGQAFWAYVGGRFGDDVIPRMLSLGGLSGDVDNVIQKVLGVSSKQLSADWQASIRATYAAASGLTPPARAGRVVIATGRTGTDLNVGPAVSPDGKFVAFLSERSLLSIDLYVADARTGRVLHKLTSTATDPHYSSLQFIYSAGAWDSTSRQLASAAVISGKGALAIFDAQRGSRTRDIIVPNVDEVLNPTWAPDGHAIAFTGMSRGLTDLYIFDLATNAVRRLTNDAFADVHPAWSPDGRRIAFATDRFSTKLDTLDIGTYDLAVLDVASGQITEIGPFARANNINPQWTADSSALYFLSDRDGISNIYRVSVANNGAGAGGGRQITTIATGISGITSSSPAIAVASAAGSAFFSVYDDGKYAIRALDMPGTGAAATAAEATEAALPPRDRKASSVAELLQNATIGLPSPQASTSAGQVTDYKPRLALEGIGQPTVGVGASQFGAAIGGGVSFQFSDLLNTQVLAAAVQLNSGISGSFSTSDTAVQAMYFNQAHRWNWGIAGGQVPYLSAGFQSGLDVQNGQVVGVDQTIVFRQTERSASGVTAYPFDRARRIEFQGGVTQIAFDQIIQTTTYDPVSGLILDESTNSASAGPGLTLGTTSAAFVYDTSSFGATSPVAGQRFRMEVSPTFGSVNYAGVLTDFRRYFMPLPFYTLAARVMHYGRYGAGGEDPRLFPLYLGYPTLVHGYDVNSFDQSDCVATATSACPLFDRLTGSRLAVANLEFRFPLLRPFGVSQRMYGPVPIEVAFFGDGGVTWGRGDRPSITGGTRRGVSSAGVALRANLFGYAVGEFAVARPFQRPGRGWVFQFNLAPGF